MLPQAFFSFIRAVWGNRGISTHDSGPQGWQGQPASTPVDCFPAIPNGWPLLFWTLAPSREHQAQKFDQDGGIAVEEILGHGQSSGFRSGSHAALPVVIYKRWEIFDQGITTEVMSSPLHVSNTRAWRQAFPRGGLRDRGASMHHKNGTAASPPPRAFLAFPPGCPGQNVFESFADRDRNMRRKATAARRSRWNNAASKVQLEQYQGGYGCPDHRASRHVRRHVGDGSPRTGENRCGTYNFSCLATSLPRSVAGNDPLAEQMAASALRSSRAAVIHAS